MEDLRNELKDIQLDDAEKEDIVKLYIVLDQLMHNIIELSNEHNKKIFYNNDIDQKKSIQLFDCSDIEIVVNTKMNHILLHNCKDIKLIISNGIISGVDILSSKNITLIFKKYSYYHIELSYSSLVKIFIEKELLEFLMILALYSLDCKLITYNISDASNQVKINKKVNLLSPLFDNSYIYTLNNNNLYCCHMNNINITDIHRMLLIGPII
jgi:hypothetical protein